MDKEFLDRALEKVHSNPDHNVADTCVTTVGKLVTNCLKDPNNPKFRQVRMNNQAIRNRVLDVAGGLELMLAAGFEELDMDGERVLIMLNEDDAVLTEVTTRLAGAVSTAQPTLAPPTHVDAAAHEEALRRRHEAEERVKEMRRKKQEEKARLRAELEADKRERKKDDGLHLSSHARPRPQGGGVHRYGDIGVNLNAGGG
eukprot:GFYU01001096.1.p1 GENE.GFYU01001096.1~~GFYU01001096.1.p1  ORF type:complete len:200 (-),score=50.55 GFYU01001096.1:496-1095(-)